MRDFRYNLTVLLSLIGVAVSHCADLNDLLKPVPGAQEFPTGNVRGGSVPPANPRATDPLVADSVKPVVVGGPKGPGAEPQPAAPRVLTETDLIDAIKRDLPRRFSPTGDLSITLLRPWKPLELPGEDFFADCVQLPGAGLSSMMSFVLRGVSNGKIIGEWPMQIRVEVWKEVWVAAQRLDRGQIIDRGMLTMQRVDVLREQQQLLFADADYLGFEVAQSVQQGRALLRRDIVERNLVKRGQIVDAVATEGGLNIRMRAMAVESGPLGAVIRVRNLDSQKEFVAQVLNENQVQVRF